MVMKYACSLFICKNTLITSNAISILTLSECLFTNKLNLLTIFPFASHTHTHFFFYLCEDFHISFITQPLTLTDPLTLTLS